MYWYLSSYWVKISSLKCLPWLLDSFVSMAYSTSIDSRVLCQLVVTELYHSGVSYCGMLGQASVLLITVSSTSPGSGEAKAICTLSVLCSGQSMFSSLFPNPSCGLYTCIVMFDSHDLQSVGEDRERLACSSSYSLDRLHPLRCILQLGAWSRRKHMIRTSPLQKVQL